MKLLKWLTSGFAEESTIGTSAGAGDAGKVPHLSSGGRLASSFLIPEQPSTLTFSGTLTIDARDCQTLPVNVMSADCAITLTNLTAGHTGSWVMLQAASGGPYNVTSIAASGFTVYMADGLESLAVNQAASGRTLYSFECISATLVVISKAHLSTASYAAETPYALKASRVLTSVSVTGTTYTHVLTDTDDKLVNCSNAGTKTITIAPNSSVATPVLSTLLVYNSGAGLLTLAAGSGVTLSTPAGYTLTLVTNAIATLIKVGTDTWIVSGTEPS